MNSFSMPWSLVAWILLVVAGSSPAWATGFVERQIPAAEVRSVTASSTGSGMVNGRSAYRTLNLVDGVRWTPWGEGAAGDGVGESVRIDLGGTRYLTRLGVITGNLRDFKSWRRDGRPKLIQIKMRSGSWTMVLADQEAMQFLELGTPAETDFVEITIKELHRGARGPASLSEVALFEPKDVLALKPAMRMEIDAAMKQLSSRTMGDVAAQRLASIGAPAVPWLVGATQHRFPEVRRRVATILGRTGAPTAASVLVRMYSDTHAEVRNAVLDALGQLKSREAVPFLLEIAGGQDPVLARKALLAMEGIGDERTLQVFVKAVMTGSQEMAAVGIRHLVGFGPVAERALSPYLRARDQAVRARAVWALGRVGGESARAKLMTLIERGDTPIVLAALRGLGETGTKEGYRVLLSNLDHELMEVREAVALSLGNFSGTRTAAVLDELIRKDPEARVRAAAWRSLERVGPAALPVLQRLVTDAPPETQEQALKRLSRSRVRGAIPALVDLLGQRNKKIRDRALAVLEKRPDGGPRALVKALGHDESTVRFVAARKLVALRDQAVPLLARAAAESTLITLRATALDCLGEIGSPAATQVIFSALNDASPKVRQSAVSAAILIPSRRYGPVLTKLLSDKDPEVRRKAVEAVGTARSKEAVEPLLESLKGEDTNRIRVIWALGQVGDARAVPALKKLMKSREALIRKTTIEALGKMGPAAMEVLMDAMLDADPAVRRSAEKALSEPRRGRSFP